MSASRPDRVSSRVCPPSLGVYVCPVCWARRTCRRSLTRRDGAKTSCSSPTTRCTHTHTHTHTASTSHARHDSLARALTSSPSSSSHTRSHTRTHTHTQTEPDPYILRAAFKKLVAPDDPVLDKVPWHMHKHTHTRTHTHTTHTHTYTHTHHGHVPSPGPRAHAQSIAQGSPAHPPPYVRCL
jgi:hypothetical protein